MCHAITKLFRSQSLWYAFYFHNVLWLFIINLHKQTGRFTVWVNKIQDWLI